LAASRFRSQKRYSALNSRISRHRETKKTADHSKGAGTFDVPHVPTLSRDGDQLLPQRRSLLSRIGCRFGLLALLSCSAVAGLAQRTVSQDAGGGKKIEIDYDAGEKVTHQRTVGPDGKTLEKVDYQYLPGYVVPQRTTTTYWPDGKARKITRATYDENANFTGELLQVFDESEKQIAGHQLTHNPWTGVYTCADWNTAEQAYKSVECPAGEESPGATEEVKKFFYDEVVHALDVARETAQQEKKSRQMHPTTPVQPPITTANKEVGIVLPVQMRPGELVSGMVTEAPGQFEGIPEVRVTRVAVPFESVGEASGLSGWEFEVQGGRKQQADGPIMFTVPRGTFTLNVTLRQTGNPAHSVSTALTLPQNSIKAQALRSFTSAAFCLKGQLCAVRGPFSGDSSKTFAAFEEHPAAIVAETPDTAYISVPDPTEPGSRPLFIAEGSKLIALPVTVGQFVIRNNGRNLQKGQTLITFPTLDGPADIPDAFWRSGNYPTSNLDLARKLVPGFQLPQKDKAAREKRAAEEIKGGEILLVIKNDTPEQILLRGSKNQELVFHLDDRSFKMGEFKYDLVVEALRPGPVNVKGYVIPFLAPIDGQEFVRKPLQSGQ
jgi:hypothetical protein